MTTTHTLPKGYTLSTCDGQYWALQLNGGSLFPVVNVRAASYAAAFELCAALCPDRLFKPNPVEEAIESYWGERCHEHEEGCVVCEAWQAYDMLVQAQAAAAAPKIEVF
jgi:hypothetical protein